MPTKTSAKKPKKTLKEIFGVDKGDIEKDLLKKNLLIAGVDEVGRGCLAGPVYSAAVILDYEKLFSLDDKTRDLIRDSKKLSHKQREKIIPIIREIAISYAVQPASVDEIDELNIIGATFLAMNRSLASLSRKPDITLVDGNHEVKGFKGKQRTLIKGDSLAYSIAAASILAKEARDQYMKDMAEIHPEYGFESHVGYGTKKHIDALEQHGVLPLHRKTFAPVARQLN
jgi:ribonuclease HII